MTDDAWWYSIAAYVVYASVISIYAYFLQVQVAPPNFLFLSLSGI